MIWLDGTLRRDHHELTLSTSDRIFEHGLGLFETFRTWNGRALLLDQHLDRLRTSAATLGIPLDALNLPMAEDVKLLVGASHLTDALIRLTVSGGQSAERPASVWMTARPVPVAPSPRGYQVADARWTVALADPLVRHKTLNYWSRRLAHEQAMAAGSDEAIFGSSDGRLWEGSRTNLFLIQGRTVITPPTSGPIIPGIMRQWVLDHAEAIGFAVDQADVTTKRVEAADEVFLTNSVRGLIPVRAWVGRFDRPQAPEYPQIQLLQRALTEFLTQPRLQP